MSLDMNQPAVAVKGKRKIKNLRWWMLALFLLGVTVNYITRNSLGILAPELKTSLGMTTEQYSWIVGAFQIAYTVFQPLCGWLIDVIGLKLGFLICAGIWALMCMLHAGAGSWMQLAILRFFMGALRLLRRRLMRKPSASGFRKRNVRLLQVGPVSVFYWCNAGTADYRYCSCFIWLAGGIHVLGRTGHVVGDPMVVVLP